MTSVGKRDFGSFHSSNVQELLDLPEDSYVPPPFPFELPSFAEYVDGAFEFGAAAKRKHFFLEEDSTYLNHGAFGAALKDAFEAAQKWQKLVERQPLRFLDREMFPHLAHVTRRLAKFVGCDRRDLVLVQNATTAFNTVLKSIPFSEGDIIYFFDFTYGSLKKLCRYICEQTGAVIQEESISFPIEHEDQIVNVVNETLKPGTKLAVFDHIPSNIPFVMPIKRLIMLCHNKNVPVLIDGAHALGNLPLNLSDINPDYYFSNAHKWFCCPRGCAFMYVRKELQPGVRALTVSHGFGSGFCSESTWTGARDYSPYLALHTVLDFWNAVGSEKIWDYAYGLLKEAATMLVKEWKTRLVAPLNMFTTMALVQLPDSLHEQFSEPIEYKQAEIVQNILFRNYNIEVPIKTVLGYLYVRISVHIYNEMAEYIKLKDAIFEIIKLKIIQ